MSRIGINDVVKFKKNHKYRGCFGIVESIEKQGRNNVYQIVVPFPESGGERTFATSKEVKKIGKVEV